MRKNQPELTLEEKANRYDKIVAARSFGGQKAAAVLTAEQLSARAKKAVNARIQKYNQNMRQKIKGEF